MPAPRSYPTPALAHRVQQPVSDPVTYETLGRKHREEILAHLPDDWRFAGKRVLDFGCGPGRVLQHFRQEMDQADFSGCDIHAQSIEWASENLDLPAELVVAAPEPPLPWPDGSFDLIWALSVFTHITDNWAEWLCEMHRILADDGLLLASFHGEGSKGALAAEPWKEDWDEDHFGMNVLQPYLSWEVGGPAVFHSRWWLELHWGRAFDVVEMRGSGFSASVGEGHGTILMRKKGPQPTPDQLSWPEADEPREVLALRHNVKQLSLEIRALRDERDVLLEDRNAVRDDRDRLALENSAWLPGPIRQKLSRLRRRARQALRPS